jgi:predicted secreted Zn-dependent protease
MDTNDRLKRLAERLEAMRQDQERARERWQQFMAKVEKHERWQRKVERSLVAGIEAAQREWRNGDKPEAG